MIMYRTRKFNPRPHPGTYTPEACCLCHKPLGRVSSCYMIRLVDGGLNILHPEDEALYEVQLTNDSDLGWHAIGSDCARRLGRQWTVVMDVERHV